MRAVHLPDRETVGGVVLEQEISLAVTVEVAGVLKVPARGGVDGADLRARRHRRAVHLPFGDAVGSIVQEQQIGLVIAVEIARTREMPAAGGVDGTDLRTRGDLRAIQLPDRETAIAVV